MVKTQAEETVDKMTPALQKLFDDIRKRYEVLSKSDIMARYEIGSRVDMAMGDTRRYGDEAAKLLAVALNKSESEIYNLRNVAVTWNRDEIKAIVTDQNSDGNSITFGHLRALASIKHSATRKRFYKAWMKESFSVRDLEAAIQDELGKRSSGGRPTATSRQPKTPSAGLVQLSKLTRQILDATEAIDVSVFDRLAKEPELANHKLLTTMEQVESELAQLAVVVAADRRKLEETMNTLQRQLQGGDPVPSGEEISDEILAAVGDDMFEEDEIQLDDSTFEDEVDEDTVARPPSRGPATGRRGRGRRAAAR